MSENLEVIEMPITKEEIYIKQMIEEKNAQIIKFDGFKIYGTESQKTALLKDYTLYFRDVENPKNTKMNAFTKAKYAPLDEVLTTIKPVMGEYNLGIMQIPSILEDGKVGVDVVITHTSGGMLAIRGIYIKPKKDDAQEIGSVITYTRRYTLCSILGIASEEEDDDGNSGSGKKAEKVSSESLDKMSFVALKAKVTALAKEKKDDGKDIAATISKHLTTTVAKSTEADKTALISIYNELSEL